jgi:hypothetical protein
LPNLSALIGRQTADPLLASVDRRKTFDNLLREWRVRILMDPNKVAPHMDKAKARRILAIFLSFSKDLYAAYPSTCSTPSNPESWAVIFFFGKHIGDRRRRRTPQTSIIRRVRPKLANLRSTPSRIQNGHRRFVTKNARSAVHHRKLQVIEALQYPGRLFHPSRQCCPARI